MSKKPASSNWDITASPSVYACGSLGRSDATSRANSSVESAAPHYSHTSAPVAFNVKPSFKQGSKSAHEPSGIR
jgi:hypothetical protein